MSIKLLDGITVDTDGDAFITDGGNKTVAVWATDFGGGTAVVQASPDGGTTWITLQENDIDVEYTANAIKVIDRLGQGMKIRATLSGSTSPVNLNVQLFD